MSGTDQGGAGRREVAYRVFAAEFDDADFEYSEEDDERAPNYVITPTGARVNRLFVVGVLTEVTQVNENMLRARVVDPTGAFVVYAGQYQPDAQTFLERAEPPQFVAVTGKARTFEPDDGDVIYTSIRPETINEVDAETRDRWTVQTARHTLDRLATFLDAVDRQERGDDLRASLESEGVDAGLASGVALALEHYGTTTAYLDALQEMAVQAAEVVAGERDEVDALDLAPDEGGETDVDVETVEGPAGTTADATTEPEGTASAPDAGEPAAEPETGDSESEGVEAEGSATAGVDTEEPETGESTDVDTEDSGTESGELGDFEAAGAGDGDDAGAADGERMERTETAEETEAGEAAATGEMYEMDEEERREVEEEFGTEFSTGTEVDEPGQTDIETPEAAGEADGDEGERDDTGRAAAETATDESDESVDGTDEQAPEAGSGDREPEDGGNAEEPPNEVDLADAVIETIEDLDDGDGAERGRVIETITEEYGVDPGDVEDAIQDALMSGKCYEPGDDRLKAI